MTKGLRSLARLLDKVPFAPVVGLLFGLAAGILILATPGWLFEHMVAKSGLPELVAAAAPPLGDKARIMAAFLALLGVAATLWVLLVLLTSLVKPRPAQSRGSQIEPDGDEAHPDAPLRRPLFAEADLGAPFMSDEAIAHARDELVLETLAPDEEFEDALASPAEPDFLPAAAQVPDQGSISGLLDRLEQALERRERRTGSSAPILPGDMAALRQALGGSALRH